MPAKKESKINVIKISKKPVGKRPKKSSRRSKTATKEPGGVLLSTELSGTSITHGHTPYDHAHSAAVKKLDERSKNLIMYIGVSVIMIVIVVIWIISLKSTLGPDAFSLNSSKPQSQANFDDLKNNLSQTLSEVKGQIKSLEDSAKVDSTTPTSTSTFFPTETVIPTTTVNPETTTTTVEPSLPKTLPN